MGRFLLKRLGQTVVILLIVSVIAFSLIQLIPGDPVYIMLGEEITQEHHDKVWEEMGLNDPLVVRYLRWMGKGGHLWKQRNIQKWPGYGKI